jgi:hypothetical protein
MASAGCIILVKSTSLCCTCPSYFGANVTANQVQGIHGRNTYIGHMFDTARHNVTINYQPVDPYTDIVAVNTTIGATVVYMRHMRYTTIRVCMSRSVVETIISGGALWAIMMANCTLGLLKWQNVRNP